MSEHNHSARELKAKNLVAEMLEHLAEIAGERRGFDDPQRAAFLSASCLARGSTSDESIADVQLFMEKHSSVFGRGDVLKARIIERWKEHFSVAKPVIKELFEGLAGWLTSTRMVALAALGISIGTFSTIIFLILPVLGHVHIYPATAASISKMTAALK